MITFRDKILNFRVLSLIVFAFGVLLFVNTWGHEYTQDDAIVIYDNMFTTEGIQGWPSILKYDTFYGFFKEEGKSKLVSGGRYRPLSLLSFALEWEFFGRNPAISHMVNSFLYGLLGVVLLITLKEFQIRTELRNWAFPLMASLLFLAHPVHTEAVANIKGRDEILCLLFSLLALKSSFGYYRSGKAKWAMLALVSIFLAGMAKENAINFVVIIPLTLWFFTRTNWVVAVRSSWPVIVGALIFLAIRFSVLGFDMGSTSWELMNNPFLKIEGNRYVPFSWSERYATILFTLGKYIQLLFFPYPLTHDYYPRHIGIMGMSNPEVWLSLVMYIALIGIAILGWKKGNWISFGISYFGITILLVSNLLFPVGTNMSERFLFMPSVGWSVVLAGAISWSHLKWKKSATIGVLSIAILLLFSFLTISRNTAWKNDLALFTTDVKVSANSAKLRNAVGGVLYAESLNQTDETQKNQMIWEAIINLQRAIEIHPNYKNAYLILGNCHFTLREHQEAELAYGNALRLDPGFSDALYNNAINNRELGRYFGSQIGDLDRAIVYLERAFQVLKKDYETARLLGTAFGYKGQHDQAIEYFLHALELSPESADAHINVAKSYLNAGNQELGNQYLNQALKIDPDALN